MHAPKGMVARTHGTENGIDWAVVENAHFGTFNGYARVPDGHPWAGLGYDDIDVNVHGGLTFAEDGWIGFDTMHFGDAWNIPELPGPFKGHEGAHHWTPEEVEAEAKDLARQVADAGK